MRKKQILFLLALATTLMVGCENQNAQINMGTENETTNESEIGSNDESRDVVDGTTNSDSQFQVPNYESDIVTVTFDQIKNDTVLEDGTTLFSTSFYYPIVSIKDNENASKAINDHIKENENAFFAETKSRVDEIRDEYDTMDSEQLEYFSGYTDNISYTLYYICDDYVSFTFDRFYYFGGAHGGSVQQGVTYNTKTGESILLNDLFTDSETGLKEIKEYIAEQCDLEYYKMRIFEDSMANVDTLIDDTHYYLSKDGIHFHSNEYELGSYAAGAFEFIVPYVKLSTLKEEYNPSHMYYFPAIVGQTISVDLDNDGKEEELYYNAADSVHTLTINGKDYSSIFKSEVEMMEYDYFVSYYVCDIDTTDNYKELAIYDSTYSDYSRTHFLRFEDGKITYLGFIPSNIAFEDFYVTGDGIIATPVTSQMVQTAKVITYYRVKDGKLVDDLLDWYPVVITDWNKDYMSHNLLQNVTVYTSNDLSSETKELTPEDGPVTLPATDNVEWYQIVTKDGTTYYLHLIDSFNIDKNGEQIPAFEIFDNLYLAG